MADLLNKIQKLKHPLVGCFTEDFSPMHLLFVDKLCFCWPEDTKAEILLVHLVPGKAYGRLLLCQ